jgi:predicted pyridoxine 5'-phosphate oxidase superfamily flavin-nucleotide-binding protein
MAYTFGSLVFTPVIKALQERHGSRRQYARREDAGYSQAGLGPSEVQFLAECDSFYMASIGATGWPYVQHRGGAKGFLKVIEEHTIAFADFRGNKQFISTGNLATDDRVALIMVDYPRQARLKILGRVKIVEGTEAMDWVEKVRDAGYQAVVERVFVIHVEAFDWNCQQHITPRFTQEQIQTALSGIEERVQTLEQENQRLQREVARLEAERASA